MKREWLLGAVLALGLFLWFRRGNPPAEVPAADAVADAPATPEGRQTKPRSPNPPRPRPATSLAEVKSTSAKEVVQVATRPDGPPKKALVLPYRMVQGLMVVQGDLVVGVPTRPDAPEQGRVQMPSLKLWTGGVIPYHIQPDVPRPERIQEAIALFQDSPIHFVPSTTQDDVLVFEVGEKDCLSYVGRMGGKQPLFLAPGCGPTEIAHEILHALGFVHEQNRSDRDRFVQLHPENIDDRYLDNFEKLPPEFMRVSELGPFDFQSLMIYPAWMFARNGQSTMEPLVADALIAPGTRPSAGDLQRLNRAYGISH